MEGIHAGSLPLSLANTSNLQFVDISSNKLTGMCTYLGARCWALTLPVMRLLTALPMVWCQHVKHVNLCRNPAPQLC